MAGLNFALFFNSGVDISMTVESLFNECLAGYFTPHTSGMLAVYTRKDRHNPDKRKRIAEGIGAFKNWQRLGLVQEALFTGTPLPLLDEDRSLDNLWTTCVLPSCLETVTKSIEQYREAQYYFLGLFGNLVLRLDNSAAGLEIPLFREIWPRTTADIHPRGPIRLWGEYGQFYDFEALLKVTLSRTPHDDRAVLGFHTRSDLWLEHGEAFHGRARAAATYNTEMLASKIRDCVEFFEGDLDSVVMSSIERVRWIAESERLYKTFQAIPGLEIS
jgi:hypothetical protein